MDDAAALTAEAPADPQPPYLRWRVVDESGALVADPAQPDLVITVQGPREGAVDDDALWEGAPVTTVRDFTGQSDYVGPDLDPNRGEFLVKQLPDDANPAAIHDVAAGEHYRVRPAEGPGGFLLGENAGWTALGAATDPAAPVDDLVLMSPGISVMSIPNPDPPASGNTTLRVTKLGTRLADGSVAKLSGARFYATAGTVRGAQPNMNNPGTYTCVTNAQGFCDMVVPTQDGSQSGSNGGDRGYWVFEGAAPANWDRITQIGTGNYSGAKTASNYMFFTGNVTGRSTIYEVTKDTTSYSRTAGATGNTTPSTTTTTDEHGVANARSNPGFPAYCGLSIAMVFDISTSINQSEMTSMKNAANTFIGSNGLGGTDSKVALYKFGTQASKMLSLTSILTSGGQGTVSTSIGTLPADPSTTSQYTNWDDAMRKVAFNGSEKYDVVLFMTDGDPTVHDTNPVTSGQGSEVETTIGFRNVEEGAFSANAVKEMTGPSGQRTKVVAVGIGLATNSYLNLKAISGPTANEDYFTTSFTDLAALLQQKAKDNCGGTLTIAKKTVNAQGEVISESAGNWEFQATTPDGNYIENPPGSNVGTLKKTTPAGGGVNFPIDLTTASSRAVNVVETQKTDWTPVSVTCTGGTPTWSGNFAGSFSVNVARDAIVSCTVTNKQAPQTANATWKKVDDQTPAVLLGGSEWTIVGPGFTAPNNVIVDCTAAGCAGLDKDPIAGQFKLEGLAIGTYTVTETKAPTGHSGGNSFEIVVNSSNAGTTIDKGPFVNKRLTGTATWKKVSSANAQQPLGGSEWKLVGPGHPGPNGSTVVDCTGLPCNGADKDPVEGQFKVEGLAWGDYTLTETKAPFGYLLDQTPHAFTVTKDNVSAAIVVGTFKNVPIVPPTPPLTGGIGSDQILLGGAGVIAVALMLAGLMRARRRSIRTGAGAGG